MRPGPASNPRDSGTPRPTAVGSASRTPAPCGLWLKPSHNRKPQPTSAPGLTVSVAISGGSSLGQLRRGVADRCVLGLLEGQERYGFDLAKILSRAQLIAGEGTIYPLLSRLRREGLVEAVWRESAEGPPRRYYALTHAGSAQLAQFRLQWAQFSAAVSAVLNSQVDNRGDAHDTADSD